MAAKSPTGGGNRSAFWEDDGAGSADTPIIVLDKNETTDIAGNPLIDNVVLTLANKQRNEAFLTFLEGNLSKVNLQNGQQDYEDGTFDSLVNIPGDSVSKMHVIHVDGEISGKRRVTYIRGVLTGDTGSDTRASGSLGDTPVEVTAIPASGTYTLDSTVLFVAVSDYFYTTDLLDMTFPVDSYGTQVYFSVK